MRRLDYQVYTDKLSRLLNIEVPHTIEEMDRTKMVSPTTIAQYSKKENTITIWSKADIKDIYFSIAHELRHIWQLKYHENEYFDNYKTASELELEAYNLQAPELDANAFALIIMEEMFEISPLFQGLPDRVIMCGRNLKRNGIF